MALDSDGVVTVAKLELNKDGFLESAGGALVIPYLNDAYDLWLFPSEDDADNNDTSNALRLADNILGVLPDAAIETLLINDLSQAYTFKTVALMKASSIIFPVGKKIVWQGYYDGSDGGSNWGLVTSGSHTDDGGSVFTLLDGKYVKANLKGDSLNAQKFGVVGDYDTDDSAAFISSLSFCDINTVKLDIASLKIRVTESIDFPPIVIGGNGSANIMAFPSKEGDKAFLSPGNKTKIRGGVIFFSGTANKSINTVRSDKFSSFTYCFGAINGYSAPQLNNLSIILDVDVFDAGGNLTTPANDNGSDADCIFLTQSTMTRLNDVTIFGYAKKQGFIAFNQDGGDNQFDPDYIEVYNSKITSGVAIIGHDVAAGAASEGLTGIRFLGTSIHGADYHNRPFGDYTINAVFVDGFMGTGSQNAIRGQQFTACSFATYANDSINLDNCNDIGFVNCTTEFPTLAGVANADAQGGFTGTSGTKRFRAIALAGGDDINMNSFLSNITGPFQVIGAGSTDQSLFGADGVFVRVGAGSGDPFIQFHNDFGTQAQGWKIEWDVTSDRLAIKNDTKSLIVVDRDGGLRKGFGPAYSGNLTISSGEVTLGSGNFYSLSPEIGDTDELTSLLGGEWDGQIVTLRTTLGQYVITVKDAIGNFRLVADRVLQSGQDRLVLQWDGATWCELSYTDNS